jgi:hypothetical protein
LYTNVLGRTSYAANEIAYWSNLLRTGQRSASSVAEFFFTSPEMVRRNLNNNQYVTTLYVAIMGRTPAQNEVAYWSGLLSAGHSRASLIPSFTDSPEFGRLISGMGGAATAQPPQQPPAGDPFRLFATHLYAGVLGRHPAENEISYWANRLRNGSETGTSIAHFFFFSDEMVRRGLSNEQYARTLYQALFNRTPAANETAHWTRQLDSGVSRFNVFVGFVTSDEFRRLCNAYGIQLGELPQHLNTMRGDTNLVKIWNHIATANFSGISDRPEHIAGIIGNMQSEAGPALCPFQIQVSNHVGLGLLQWSFGRRINLESFMFRPGSGVTREEFEAEMNKHLHTYVCPPGTHPQGLLDRVLALQVEFMFHELRNTSEREYMTYINFPTVRTGSAGARAYAELFCSIKVRPGPGMSEADDIQDLGVQNALLASPYSGGRGIMERISFAGLAVRRNRADAVFLQANQR